MGVRYLFPAWARRTIGSTSPADVKRWFDERGVVFTHECWRNLLRRKPKSIPISTWAPICNATGLPLSAFIEVIPGEAPVRRQPPTPRRKAKKEAPVRPGPPRPADFLGVS